MMLRSFLRFSKILLATLMLMASSPLQILRAEELSVEEAQAQRIQVVEDVAPSVVAIFSASGSGGGSGVLISPDGYALSNFHVTSGAGDFMKCGLNNGKLYDAVIVGIDPTGDVALLKLLGRDDFPVARIGDSDTLKAGDWVYAMGNPFLLATDFKPTVTYGIVSGTHRYQYPAGSFLEYTDCIQTDSSINPGNSGGPLFNSTGELVGINGRGSFEKRGRVNSGAGYAISINQIMNFLDHLKSGRIVDHATLGATVASQNDGSVVVESILEDSEAFRRGLREGDEIVSFAGRPIRSVNQYKNILGIYPKGWKLPLEFRREQQKRTIFVRLSGLHTVAELTPKKQDAEKKPPPGSPPPKPTVPAEHAHLLVEKPGFMNYYFNKQEQDRIFARLAEWGDYSTRNGEWKIGGKNQAGVSFEATLNDSSITFSSNGQTMVQPLDGSPLLAQPEGSGGLLVALHHMRLFLSQHGFFFSEFAYLGSEPMDGRGERVDVITSELTAVNSRWFFSRDTGQLLGFDTQLSGGQDECEVRFETPRDFNGVRIPTKWLIRSGGKGFAEWTIESFEAGVGPKPAGRKVSEVKTP